MVQKITANEFDKVRSDKVAVVDFSAEWCGPCKMLAPVLEQVSEEMAGKAEFYNVDVDAAPALAREFGITNIPAVLLLKNGAVADASIGFVPKEAIAAFVSKNLG